mmetsp:Transcript_17895/g.54770  ORF Transcript_17895/g.54770 Transcript_17895/m.54770 type:complete len:211 (-) Transcript_17895:706-1338(-)
MTTASTGVGPAASYSMTSVCSSSTTSTVAASAACGDGALALSRKLSISRSAPGGPSPASLPPASSPSSLSVSPPSDPASSSSPRLAMVMSTGLEALRSTMRTGLEAAFSSSFARARSSSYVNIFLLMASKESPILIGLSGPFAAVLVDASPSSSSKYVRTWLPSATTFRARFGCMQCGQSICTGRLPGSKWIAASMPLAQSMSCVHWWHM